MIFLQLIIGLKNKNITEIMKFKDRWRNYKNIGIFCIIFVIIIIFFVIYDIFRKNKKQEIKEEWININKFSNILQIGKEWKILSYPEVTVLSETDWEVMTLNVTEWDIVEEWDVLMQIWDENWEIVDIDIDTRLWRQFTAYYQKKDEYNQFESEYWEEILDLEKELREKGAALSIAIDSQDKKTIENIQEETQKINKKLTLLKNQRENLKSEVTRLDNNILLENQENIDYLYEIDKYSPRAPIYWIVSEIYVNEWDKIEDWDKLLKIVDNSFTPEISVSLSFDEYLLTKNLTWVTIVTENKNRWNSYYYGEIYTRSPILNWEWEYTITVNILEEVSDLILSDENTKITVYFTINSENFKNLRIPSNCFSSLWKNNWKIILRDGDLIQEKEVWIKSKWNWWNNVENFVFLWLENEEKKDGIKLLCKIE